MWTLRAARRSTTAMQFVSFLGIDAGIGLLQQPGAAIAVLLLFAMIFGVLAMARFRWEAEGQGRRRPVLDDACDLTA